jgi:Domain of unknown function (DUF4169)
MGEIVNLRRARKRLERQTEAAKAAQNRVAFGLSKGERRVAEAESDKAERDVEARKLESDSPHD